MIQKFKIIILDFLTSILNQLPDPSSSPKSEFKLIITRQAQKRSQNHCKNETTKIYFNFNKKNQFLLYEKMFENKKIKTRLESLKYSQPTFGLHVVHKKRTNAFDSI